MVMSKHDIPGTQKFAVTIPKLADKVEGEWVTFVAPFKCVVYGIDLVAGEAWVGLTDATNYEKFIAYSRGVNGTASAVALGTVLGSAAGTPIYQGSIKALYSSTTGTPVAANSTFTVRLGTAGAGSTAPPAMTVITSFKAA